MFLPVKAATSRLQSFATVRPNLLTDMADLEGNRHVGGIDGVAAELLTITAEPGAFTKDIGEPGSGI